ncbi:MAG: VOC family protein [Chloroflexi bacterium]|nr:VOC family protein [Chloroflexota bacterium]
MALKLNHVHLKTPDPEKTAQFYIDTLGATKIADIGDIGVRLDLHGLTLNVTKHIESQTRDVKYGIEHIALDADNIDELIDSLKKNGAKILEETSISGDRKVVFFEGPDGVQLEFIENK